MAHLVVEHERKEEAETGVDAIEDRDDGRAVVALERLVQAQDLEDCRECEEDKSEDGCESDELGCRRGQGGCVGEELDGCAGEDEASSRET